MDNWISYALFAMVGFGLILALVVIGPILAIFVYFIITLFSM